jgi:hypothetical protein
MQPVADLDAGSARSPIAEAESKADIAGCRSRSYAFGGTSHDE